MGQPNLERMYQECKKLISSAKNDDQQTLSDTSLFKLGDTLDLVLVDADGCIASVVTSGLTITAICPNAAVVVDSAVDTSTPPAGQSYYFLNRSIDDAQQVIDRLKEYSQAQDYLFRIAPSISAQVVDSPLVGQSTLTISSDIQCMGVGDTVSVVCDEGAAIIGATVISIDKANSEVVIDDNTDLSSFNNCKLVNDSLTLAEIISRLKDSIAAEDDDEDLGEGDCKHVAFEIANVFVQGSSQVYLDGVKKLRGTAGTRASLDTAQGANIAVSADSLVLGLDGNAMDFSMTDPAGASQPLVVSVTGQYPNFSIDVQLETDGGSSIISTAQDVADALNADADAGRLAQWKFDGTGAGVVSAYASSNFAGGLDDGTRDYAEIERLVGNSNSGTGYKIIAFHIRPSEKNRLNKPFRDSEELEILYKK